MKPVLQALVDSPEFAAAAGRKVRDPSQDVVATFAVLGTQLSRPGQDDTSAASLIVHMAETVGLAPMAWPLPDGSPQLSGPWTSPARMMASFDMHWKMANRSQPSLNIVYRQPADWLPAASISLRDLVDHLARTFHHRPSTPTLLQACCEAVELDPGEIITARTRWSHSTCPVSWWSSSTTPTTSRDDDPTARPCCDLGASGVTRRGLFRAAAATGGVMTFGSAFVATASATPGVSASSIIVVLSLRGAADGLSLVVPHGDRTYYKARPTIAVPRGSLLARDDTFGLHPALRPLLPMWKAGKLGAVHATGMRIPNRSHFAAMEVVEDADPGSAARIGWLNRLVGTMPGTCRSAATATVRASTPTSLYGPVPVMSVTDLGKIQVAGADPAEDPRGVRRRSLGTTWGAEATELGAGARSALAASIELLPSLQQPDTSTAYPTSDLGQALAAVSRVLKADTGTSLVTVDQGDWDHHTGVGSVTYGRMLNNTSGPRRRRSPPSSPTSDRSPTRSRSSR